MAQEPEEDEFEIQLRQEELARLAKEDGELLSRGMTYADDDGTVMEWDHERKAYFPKIDADFIAQYQINYGVNSVQQSGQGMTEEEKRAQSEEYWRNYYNVYSQEQPPLPKLDEEGNPIEESKETPPESQTTQSQPGNTDKNVILSKEGQFDPSSEEHYQYNLYYYGKQYADACRDYYREHPDAEAMPDFIVQNASTAGEASKKEEDLKKGKKNQAEKRKEPPREEGWFEVNAETSTQLYVTGLPSDVTEEEFKELMSKCGLIMFDPHTHQPKLKLYKDKEGNLKGDGLCTYIKPESVTLALQLLDGMDFRGHTLCVERAKFELKGQYDPKKKKKKLSNKAKQKLRERQQKLFDWRPDKNPYQRAKHERVVILKNMFDVKEFDMNPALINELRADVREECLKFGEVKKVILYDRSPEGVISVSFKEPEEADGCVVALNGRWFAQRKILATTHDGKTKYDVVETEEEKAKRLNQWQAYLEGKQKEEEAAASRECAVLQQAQDTRGKYLDGQKGEIGGEEQRLGWNLEQVLSEGEDKEDGSKIENGGESI